MAAISPIRSERKPTVMIVKIVPEAQGASVSVEAGHATEGGMEPAEDVAQILAALDAARSALLSGVRFDPPSFVRPRLVVSPGKIQ